MAGPKFTAIEEYVASFTPDVQAVLRTAIGCVRDAAPDARESISYDMAAFRLPNDRPIHVGAWTKHVSLYGVPLLDGPLEAEVAPHRGPKGTISFKYKDRLPVDLIERIVHAVAALPRR